MNMTTYSCEEGNLKGIICFDYRKEGRTMPEQTFFNLPEEKQENIIEAAEEEFAGRSYHQARITAIIERAGIARGSFYQYFEDKKDFFKYIIELCVGEKLKYINQDMIKKDRKSTRLNSSHVRISYAVF